MIAKGKILVSMSSSFASSAPNEVSAGSAENQREEPHFLIASAIVESIDRKEISVVELRMILPSRSAQAMLRSMVDGETDLAITGMSPVTGLR